MSTPGPEGRNAVGTVIKVILGLQLGMGGLLIASDLGGSWQNLSFTPAPPRMEQPVRPGDQTRRYRPAESPGTRPGHPFPAAPEMPDRLRFEPAELEGAPVLRLTGQIAIGDAERLTDYLETATPRPETAVLNSSGGSVEDALAIGRLLRANGLGTRILGGDICLSACPYILAAGVTRVADDEAHVGVHQHYFGENVVQPAFMAVEDIQRGQGRVMDYLDEMGIDPLVMRHALVTPPDEIYILLPEELRQYRLTLPE